MKMETQKQVLSPQHAAERLGLSESTLAKMRLRGDGPSYIKLGVRRVGYLEKDLVDWVEARRFRSTSEYGR